MKIVNINEEINVSHDTNNMQQNENGTMPNNIKSVVSSCNGNENDLMNDSVSINADAIDGNDGQTCKQEQNGETYINKTYNENRYLSIIWYSII